MSKEKETTDLITRLEEKIMNGFKAFSTRLSKIKNEVTLTLQDGSAIYVVPADPANPDELMGASILKVDEAGLPTTESVLDGPYPLNDGRTIVVTAGKVTEVQAVTDPNAALKTELAAKDEALKAASAEIAALKASHESLKASNETDKVEMKKQFDSIQAAFKEFKAAVPGEKKKGPEDEDEQVQDFTKMTTAQKVRAMSKERAKFEMNLKQS